MLPFNDIGHAREGRLVGDGGVDFLGFQVGLKLRGAGEKSRAGDQGGLL